MKNTKRRLEPLSFFNHTGISRHLEKMAAKGWMIEKIVNTGWVYRRMEPKNIHFAVSYFPKASAFDPEPTEEQKMFYDFCAHTGWQLACSSAQLQIFYNERENPTPIETDPELELQAIHASAKKSFIPSYILLLVVAFMNGGLWISNLLSDPIDLLFSPTKLFTGFAFLILIVHCVVELVCYFRWHSKAAAAAEHGEFRKVPDTSKFQKAMLFPVMGGAVFLAINYIICGNRLQRWVAILMCIYMPALFVIVNATKEFLKRKKASSGINCTVTMLTSFIAAFAMMGAITFGTLYASNHGLFADKDEETYSYGDRTWVIHQDDLPLAVEDLVDVDFNGYIKERHENTSLFLDRLVMYQHPRFDAENYKDAPQLDYIMIIVHVPSLYEMCKNLTIDKMDETHNRNIPEGFKRVYLEQDPAPWKANEVYQLAYQDTGTLNRYLLCYDDRIIEISFDWTPTIEQMAIVAEKLNGNERKAATRQSARLPQ